MFITRALMFYIKRKKIPGRLDIGKHQLVKPVTLSMKKAAIAQLCLEKQNFELLQNPYLTEAEEACSVAAESHSLEEYLKLRDAEIREKMLKHRFMDEHLGHLNVTKQWE